MKNNILDKIKARIPYAILILIIILPWFLKSGYLFFTDMSAGPHVIVPKFTASGFFYYHSIVKILSYVLPVDLIQKLFFAVIFGLVLFGGHRIARGLTQNKALLFLGSAFALFNPFIYDRLMYGQIGVILGYGFFLAFFGYLLSFYFSKLKKQFFLSSVFAGLAVLFSPHFLFFVGLFYFVFGFLIFTKNWKDKTELLKIAKYFALSIIIIVAINFNWLLGVIIGDSQMERSINETITAQDLEAFKTAGGTDMRVIENVFLMSGFWGAEQFRYEPLQNIKENWGRSFYFLLPIIILGLIYNFKDKSKRGLNIGLILLYFAAFILALGIALPSASKITIWLFNNVPFYKGLREPQKWVVALVAIYEVLLICGLNQLLKRNIVIKNKGLLTALLTFIILLQAPLMVWGGAGQIKPANYPRDWYEVNEFVTKEINCKTKILFLPWHSYMNFNWTGKIIANPAPKFFNCPVIYGQNMEFGGIFGHSADLNEREVEKWVLNVGRTNLLEENKLNIGYIILAKEVDWQNYLW
ncbi:MAG: hypothetical protein AAB723_00090, partial [Patescibacteria group bacterium]